MLLYDVNKNIHSTCDEDFVEMRGYVNKTVIILMEFKDLELHSFMFINNILDILHCNSKLLNMRKGIKEIIFR